MENKNMTTIFYDGMCHLCSREIKSYKRQDSKGVLKFVDITSENFNAVALGLDSEKVKHSLHVRCQDGSIVAGIDSFCEIWRRLGIFTWLIFLMEHQPSRQLFKVSYAIFAQIRPVFSKKTCEIDF